MLNMLYTGAAWVPKLIDIWRCGPGYLKIKSPH